VRPSGWRWGGLYPATASTEQIDGANYIRSARPDVAQGKDRVDILLIPEYCFGVEIAEADLVLSDEHTEYRWSGYVAAEQALRWDSNRIALWELNHRLCTRPVFE
jgi:dATP pyrophosphohydrolase